MFTAVASAAMLKNLKEKELEGEDVDEKETIKRGPKLYPCPQCGYKFNRRFNRDKHVELIHKIPRPERPPLYPQKVKYISEKPEEKKKNQPAEPKPKEKMSAKPVESEEKKKSVEPKEKTPELSKSPTLILPPEKKKSPIKEEMPAKLEKQVRIFDPESMPQAKRQKGDIEIKKEPPAALPVLKPKPSDSEKKSPWGRKTFQKAIVVQTQLPVLTVYYCGQCLSPRHHRYVQLPEKDAVLLVPICKKCNELNLSLEKSIKAAMECKEKQ